MQTFDLPKTERQINVGFKKSKEYAVRFQVLTVARMKMIAFRDIAPCSIVEVYRRFRVAYCLLYPREFIDLMMEAVRNSETTVSINEITWCHIPESYHLQVIFRLAKKQKQSRGQKRTSLNFTS
jgi:hypothetical protein